MATMVSLRVAVPLLRPIYTGHLASRMALIPTLATRGYSNSTIRRAASDSVLFQHTVPVTAQSKLFVSNDWLPVHVSHRLANEVLVQVVLAKEISAPSDGYGVDIRQEDGAVYVTGSSAPPVGLQPTLKIELPPSIAVSITTRHQNGIWLDQLQTPEVVCSTEDGTIRANGIRCDRLVLAAIRGNIELGGAILGDVDVCTGGAIHADRLQGAQVRLQAGNGEVRVGAIYANDCEVVGHHANLHLANMHGNAKVILKQGDLHIVGLDGSLTATVQNGNADVHISRLGQEAQAIVSAINGQILLKLSQDLVARLRLEGKDVVVDEAVRGRKVSTAENGTIVYEGNLNDGVFLHDPLIVASAPSGSVSVAIQNWLSAVQSIEQKAQ